MDDRATSPHDTIGELLRYGRVASVDVPGARITVALGDIETQPLPWLSAGAGGTRVWSRPKIGEQVMLIAPEGDLAGAIALRGAHCDAFPPIGDATREVVMFEDGAALSYNPATHALEAVLPGGATVKIVAPGGVRLEADVRIAGDLHVEGTVTADTDVVGAGKSLKGHRHTGVAAGAAVSGAPQ